MSQFEHDSRLAQELSDKIVPIIMEYQPAPALMALYSTVAVLTCNQKSLTTLTEAIDQWRISSRVIEKIIRQKFGEVRHGK